MRGVINLLRNISSPISHFLFQLPLPTFHFSINMSIVKSEVTIGGKVLSLEIGRFAKLANAAVVARYGDTMILATVVSSKEKSNLSYFPLTVEYAERLYAGGKIKGSRWVKREGRPSDEAILSARLIDRVVRPLSLRIINMTFR